MPNVTPPPVPTQQAMTDSAGRATRPWISWFTTLGQIFGFNQTVQVNGAVVPQELVLNFLSPLTATDNPSNGSTDIGINIPKAAYSIQFGDAQALSTGNDFTNVYVEFPNPFDVAPKVFLSVTNFPRGVNTPMTCYPTNISTAGFTANLACAVPTGGGGATIDSSIMVDWLAIG